MSDTRRGKDTSEFVLSWVVTVAQVGLGIFQYVKTGQFPEWLLPSLGITAGGYSISRGHAKRGQTP